MGLLALRHVGSSQTRAQTRVPCIGRWILNHCAIKEAPLLNLLKSLPLSKLFWRLPHLWSLFSASQWVVSPSISEAPLCVSSEVLLWRSAPVCFPAQGRKLSEVLPCLENLLGWALCRIHFSEHNGKVRNQIPGWALPHPHCLSLLCFLMEGD